MDFIRKFFLKHEISSKKLRVKLKTTIFASVTAAIFFASLFTVVYFLGFTVLRDKKIESQGEMARALASAVNSAIEKQIESLKFNANNQFVIDTLKADNLKYKVKSEKEVQRYLMDMDKRWIEATDEHPFLKDYLENPLSLRLKEPKAEGEGIVSVIVTDKFGGLAGSTTRPSGFYSFDQDWWLNSYAKGRGKLFIGRIEYDEQSNLWCLPFAVPIEDETGNVIGIYKAEVSIDTFFKPLLNFKLGKTGDAVLVDDKTYLLYHQKAAPYANKYCEYEEFQKTLQNNDKGGVLDSAYLNRGKTLAAYSEVNSPSLSRSPKVIDWFVFVERDLSEISAPLNKLIFVMVLIGIALTIVLALYVFILSVQESPGSILQVTEETPAAKTEENNSNRA